VINRPRIDNRIPYYLLSIFLVLTVSIIFVGYVLFQNYEQRFRTGVESQLSSIAELKANELEQWRKARLEHGYVLSRLDAFSSLVRRAYIAGADPVARRQLHNWLDAYQNRMYFDQVRLLSLDGNSLTTVPAGRLPLSATVRKQLSAVIQSKLPMLMDFYRNDHDGRVYLTLLVPVKSDLEYDKVIAVIALRIDPEKYLYPLINQWPIPSLSAETLLIRREGNYALFLNELRFQKDTALKLRRPLTEVKLPAAMAALDHEGIVEGVDYRGVPVVSYLKIVPDSPWRIVARIDESEINAPLKERLWQGVLVGTLLLSLAGVTMVLVWRQQHLVAYHRQAAMEQEKGRLHDIIKSSLNEIYLFDSKSLRFVFVNDGAICNLGYSMDELVGIRAFDIKPEFTEESFRSAIRPLLEGDLERMIFETIHRRKDGTSYPVEVYLQLIESDGDKIFLAVINDITIRRLADKELQDKNTELERFTYTVSHDLKSPIITIKGFTGALQKDLQDGRYERMAGDLKRIGNAADRMDELLRDLLELSTIGRVVNPPEVVDMNLLVKEVLEQLDGPLNNHNLIVKVQPDLPELLCDRRRLAEVLQNLIENAINYIGDQPEPEILFGVRHEDGVNVYFVKDNGIGIDKRYHQTIFGLFNKLDARSKGTGVGLSLVKRIIEVHGGRVWVESDGSGKGSTFCFFVGSAEAIGG